MRLRTLFLLSVVLALGAAGLAAWFGREYLALQAALFRVGAAASPADAHRELAWFEQGPLAPERLRHLVTYWGTGHRQFDLVLVQYLGQSDCSEALREAFSRELGWRTDLLPRWAHFWSWRAAAPDEELHSLAEFFQLLSLAEAPRILRWREVLDLQALFTLTGPSRFAQRLTPENWAPRFRQWSLEHPRPLPTIVRPAEPFY